MAKKNKRKQDGIIYSTNSDFSYSSEEDTPEETLPASEQDLRVWRDRKGGGKQVTVVKGFVGAEEDLKALGKELKTRCGVGGSTKNGEILVQGDVRDKVVEYLRDQGYSAKPAGG